jgi:hypothetical protein
MTQPMMLQDARSEADPSRIAPEDVEVFVDDLETISEKLDLIYKARRKREPEEEQAAISDLLKTWNCLKALY